MTRITVLAEEGPIAFEFEDLVRYHGHAALAMLAITFRAQEVAFKQLCGATPPERAAISITSGHPGPGVRDAFEINVSGAGTQHIAVRDGVLPTEFFQLLNAPRTDENAARFAAIKREIATEVLAEPNPENLFVV